MPGTDTTRYAPTGHIVYARDGQIVAVPFDATGLEVTGAPVTVEEDVATAAVNGRAGFSFSRTGDLLYVEARAGEERWPLLAVSREGEGRVLIAEPRRYGHPRFSANGQLLLEIGDPRLGGVVLRPGPRHAVSRHAGRGQL